MDRSEILADDAERQHLNGTEKEQSDHQWRNSNRKTIPVDEFVD
jgi:hypothetical protein